VVEKCLLFHLLWDKDDSEKGLSLVWFLGFEKHGWSLIWVAISKFNYLCKTFESCILAYQTFRLNFLLCFCFCNNISFLNIDPVNIVYWIYYTSWVLLLTVSFEWYPTPHWNLLWVDEVISVSTPTMVASQGLVLCDWHKDMTKVILAFGLAKTNTNLSVGRQQSFVLLKISIARRSFIPYTWIFATSNPSLTSVASLIQVGVNASWPIFYEVCRDNQRKQ
jgi:hypothetical protein